MVVTTRPDGLAAIEDERDDEHDSTTTSVGAAAVPLYGIWWRR